MIPLLYILAIVAARTESALGKYNGMKGGSAVRFNVNKSLMAAVFSLAILLLFDGELHLPTLAYSVAYGAFLAISMVAGLKALSLGSMGITSTVVSFSLVIPTIFGMIFLDEKLGVSGFFALGLLAVSLLLLNYKKSSNPISGECWFYSILTMVSNGACSVVQKLHQTAYPGEYSSAFMLFGMSAAFLVLSAVAVISALSKREEKEGCTPEKIFKYTLIFGALAGVFNGVCNYFTLLLAATENASVLFPILSAGNAVGSCLVGYLVFKERLTKLQTFSIALGAIAVVLLKI